MPDLETTPGIEAPVASPEEIERWRERTQAEMQEASQIGQVLLDKNDAVISTEEHVRWSRNEPYSGPSRSKE